ncbi:SET domain-containing protein [Candidatus Pacearchaeota archaeon]|nr:SET domain-containing protein [Candidatus Pacearchaeota archaeon]
MKNVILRKSKIGQFDKGVFADKNFKKGEIVIKYSLKQLSEDEYKNLPKKEKQFVHIHFGKKYLYASPERYVNHSSHPNTIQNSNEKCDIALRDIKKGEEITTDSSKDDTIV